jgi:hypothetical protein
MKKVARMKKLPRMMGQWELSNNMKKSIALFFAISFPVASGQEKIWNPDVVMKKLLSCKIQISIKEVKNNKQLYRATQRL